MRIIFTQIVILSSFLWNFICPRCPQLQCAVSSREHPTAHGWPRNSGVVMKSTLHTQHEIRMSSFVQEGNCLIFSHFSSKLSCPELNNRVVLCRVGNCKMMRIIGTNRYILPSFKIMYYHLQRLRILIWLSLLSFSKTEAKSGKLCFLFKSTAKVSIHTCLKCSISVTQMAIE